MQPARAPCHADPSAWEPPGLPPALLRPLPWRCAPHPGSRATFHRHRPFFWEEGKPGSTPALLLTGWVTLRRSPALFGLAFPTCEERRQCGLLFLSSQVLPLPGGGFASSGKSGGGGQGQVGQCVWGTSLLSPLSVARWGVHLHP